MNALQTDFYQFTMAQAYLRAGKANEIACFQLFFRKAPFGGSYALACGLEQVIDYVSNYRFTQNDIGFLREQQIFDEDFLDYLLDLRFSCDIDAIPEGTTVFAGEPLLSIRGPLALCQLLETPLLNIINFQTLIASKASRICLAAHGDQVVDFGMRRAQGFDGALSAARAAYVGGCASTSNTFAAKHWGIPAQGTQAHSFVMSFDSELEAFEAYAHHMPENGLFLVDTYHSAQGIENAIKAADILQKSGHRFLGIRLDSGDLLELSKLARKRLDQSRFHDAVIVASGDLDEYRIQELKAQGAQINMWGVGTRLITAFDEPALGGVYKLAAIYKNSAWNYRFKASDDEAKSTLPGILQAWRHTDNDQPDYDLITDFDLEVPSAEPLLVPIFKEGHLVYSKPTLAQIQQFAHDQLKRLPAPIKALQNPSPYPVAIHPNLLQRKAKLLHQFG